MTLDDIKKNSPVFCDSCGQSMQLEDGTNFIGMAMDVSFSPSHIKFNSVARQIAPYQMGRVYNVCWKCWFMAMGVKP